MGWPKTIAADEAPREILDLAHRLVPLLLTGDHRATAALRAQYGRASVSRVEFSGAGFFVEFSVPADAPRAEPGELTGGNARIEVEGLEHGAGCVLFVRDGMLRALEGYTYGEPWPERPIRVSLSEVVPLVQQEGPSP
jgi:hypothetical protein